MKVLLFILISIVAPLLSSCTKETETDVLTRLVREWKGRTIVMPDSLTDFLSGDPIVLDGDFTILHYVTG